MDDVRVVLDAVGSKRAALFGVSEGGPMSILFVATWLQPISYRVQRLACTRGMAPPQFQSP